MATSKCCGISKIIFLPSWHSSLTSVRKWTWRSDFSIWSSFSLLVHQRYCGSCKGKTGMSEPVIHVQSHQQRRPHACSLDEKFHNSACSQKYNLVVKAYPKTDLAATLQVISTSSQSLVWICFLAINSAHISTMSPYNQRMFISKIVMFCF